VTGPHDLPVGTELGGGLRVGHGGVITGSPVLAMPIATHQRREAAMPATKSRPSRSKSKLAVAMQGTDAELAEFLLANPTYSDATWKSRAGRHSRRSGESRSEYIARVLK
jgi:hypothetical protein